MLCPAELRARGGSYISPRSHGTRGGPRGTGRFVPLLLLLLTVLVRPVVAEPLALRWSTPLAVAEITDEPAFLLVDGRTLLPAGIRLPTAVRGEALAKLATIPGSSGVRIAERPRAEDRYGRLLVQIADASGDWLQARLVRRGLALVDPATAPETVVDALFTLEADARREGRGIWSEDGGLPAAAERVRARPLRFTVVEGRPHRAGRGRTFLYLNFGEDRRRDFTLRIRLRQLRAFARGGLDPEALVGRRIRVRGWIFPAGGPMIEVTDRRQIEVLE